MGLRDLLGFELRKDGVAVATRKVLDFIGAGFSVTDNPGGAKADVRFSAAAVSDPTTGYESRLLPQVDTSVQTANATPVDVATIALADNSVYEFRAYCHAYAAAYADETVFSIVKLIRRTGGGGATTIATITSVAINPLTITGLELVTSGNNVIVRWTGHGATTLKARIQVSYNVRPVVLPT